VGKSPLSLSHLEEERVVPWGDPTLFSWHRARYQFAAAYVAGRRVLDVGCGEGYGAALLAEHAEEVVGVDYSAAAVDHARKTYQRSNLRFLVADATAPAPVAGQFDAITCFEVIEHILGDDQLLAGLARMLNPEGWLLMSTPNALVDTLFETVSAREHNEYHVNLLRPAQLRQRVRRHFGEVRLYGQYVEGNRLHTALKALDVFNMRHRLFRSPRLQQAVAARLMGQAPLEALATQGRFGFSRLLVRQSAVLVLTARRPVLRHADGSLA
jgi:2-polyprenyl-3-methyl-5-hydroxy-6-metoxy-1,4-benzoquinol methylase